MPGNRNKTKKTAPKQAVNLRKATASLNTGNSNKSVPAAVGQVRTTLAPSIQRGGNGDSRVVHREYIADVISTGPDFQTTAYTMNPGNEKTFPWLSRIAQNYESYRFNSLRFKYETAVSSATSGTVMLIPEYDPDDPSPISKKEAMCSRSSARAQPWLSFAMNAAREDLSKRKSYYVRTIGAEPIDRRSSDTGNLFVALSGVPALMVGELWVEYDVQLMTPATPESNVGLLTGAQYLRTNNEVGVDGVDVPLLDVDGLPSGVTLKDNTLTFAKPGSYLLNFRTVADQNGTYIHANPGQMSGPGYGLNGYAGCWNVSAANEYTETEMAFNIEKPGTNFLLAVAGVLKNVVTDVICSVIPGASGFLTAVDLIQGIFSSKTSAGLTVGYEALPYRSK